MAGPANLKLLTDFFNKIGQEATLTAEGVSGRVKELRSFCAALVVAQ